MSRQTLTDKLDALPPARRDAVEYRIAEITRGYESGEYSHWTRDNSGLRLTNSESDDGQTGIALYAERNGSLHVLCHEMLGALEAAGVDMDTIHGFRERLHDVPQCRR